MSENKLSLTQALQRLCEEAPAHEMSRFRNGKFLVVVTRVEDLSDCLEEWYIQHEDSTAKNNIHGHLPDPDWKGGTP